MLLRSYITGVFILSSFLSIAHKNKFAIDSIDAITKDRVRIIEYKIGDAEYHKFGKMAIEKNGNKYYITFPFIQYIDYPTQSDFPNYIIPKGTKITVKLDNGKSIIAETAEDISLQWHFWWHYNCVSDIAPKYVYAPAGRGYFDGSTIYKYRNNIPNIVMTQCDLYGLNWLVKFQFTSADMLLLSRHNISDAYLVYRDKKITLPIKSKQSLRIQKSIPNLLHK